ncbi:pheromone-regulated protein prm10, partial [Spiromyces aspiralis]
MADPHSSSQGSVSEEQGQRHDHPRGTFPHPTSLGAGTPRRPSTFHINNEHACEAASIPSTEASRPDGNSSSGAGRRRDLPPLHITPPVINIVEASPLSPHHPPYQQHSTLLVLADNDDNKEPGNDYFSQQPHQRQENDDRDGIKLDLDNASENARLSPTVTNTLNHDTNRHTAKNDFEENRDKGSAAGGDSHLFSNTSQPSGVPANLPPNRGTDSSFDRAKTVPSGWALARKLTNPLTRRLVSQRLTRANTSIDRSPSRRSGGQSGRNNGWDATSDRTPEKDNTFSAKDIGDSANNNGNNGKSSIERGSAGENPSPDTESRQEDSNNKTVEELLAPHMENSESNPALGNVSANNFEIVGNSSSFVTPVPSSLNPGVIHLKMNTRSTAENIVNSIYMNRPGYSPSGLQPAPSAPAEAQQSQPQQQPGGDGTSSAERRIQEPAAQPGTFDQPSQGFRIKVVRPTAVESATPAANYTALGGIKPRGILGHLLHMQQSMAQREIDSYRRQMEVLLKRERDRQRKFDKRERRVAAQNKAKAKDEARRAHKKGRHDALDEVEGRVMEEGRQGLEQAALEEALDEGGPLGTGYENKPGKRLLAKHLKDHLQHPVAGILSLASDAMPSVLSHISHGMAGPKSDKAKEGGDEKERTESRVQDEDEQRHTYPPKPSSPRLRPTTHQQYKRRSWMHNFDLFATPQPKLSPEVRRRLEVMTGDATATTAKSQATSVYGRASFGSSVSASLNLEGASDTWGAVLGRQRARSPGQRPPLSEMRRSIYSTPHLAAAATTAAAGAGNLGDDRAMRTPPLPRPTRKHMNLPERGSNLRFSSPNLVTLAADSGSEEEGSGQMLSTLPTASVKPGTPPQRLSLSPPPPESRKASDGEDGTPHRQQRARFELYSNDYDYDYEGGSSVPQSRESTPAVTPYESTTLLESADEGSRGYFFGGGERDKEEEEHFEQERKEMLRQVTHTLQCQDFLMLMARALAMFGAPTSRLETNMLCLAKRLEIEASFAVLPGIILISFEDATTRSSETHILRITNGYDMNRLDKVTYICRQVIKGWMSVEEAVTLLETVLATPPLYPWWVQVLNYGFMSFLVAPCFWQGSWKDALVAGILGLFIGLLQLLATRFNTYANLFEYTSAVLVSFIATTLQKWVCFGIVSISGCVMLLPGLGMTMSIVELASKNIISGAVRFIFSIISTLLIAYGITTGSQIGEAVMGHKLSQNESIIDSQLNSDSGLGDCQGISRI